MFLYDLLSISIQNTILIQFDIKPEIKPNRDTTIQTVAFCCGKTQNRQCALNDKKVRLCRGGAQQLLTIANVSFH
jgi:hypothetical protein